jgi:hypothetical protein
MVSQTSDLTEIAQSDAARRMLDTPPEAIRIAMWSCPFSRATALMRAFSQRGDTAVRDAPFYAAYLRASGADHPMAREIIASQPNDWRRVVDQILGPVPGEKPIWFQKHITTHMLPEFGRDWIDQMTNAFLIRRPENLVRSFAARGLEPSLAAIGILQQANLFDRICDRLGKAPPVIDADELAHRPRQQLGLLCEALEIPYRNDMLEWPEGPHADDGVWGKHWYGDVEATTRFIAPQSRHAKPLPDQLKTIVDHAQPIYRRLNAGERD